MALWDISESTYDALNRARESRNFIAHEGGDIGELHRASAEKLADATSLLRRHVENVAHGDNIASSWAYAVSEREPAPRGMVDGYVSMVMTWVFDPKSFNLRANEP